MVNPSELRFIVEGLSKPPFNQKKETVVSFSQKKPKELLQCLNDVFSALSTKMTGDVTGETDEALSTKYAGFLGVLNYKPTLPWAEFGRLLIGGDAETIHHILQYIFQRVAELQKRVYLSRFLTPVVVPEEFKQDSAISQLISELSQLQDSFKTIHKKYDSLAKGTPDVSKLKKKNLKLEADREQLKSKVAVVKAKVDGVEKGEELVSLLRQIRQTEEEVKSLDVDITKQRDGAQTAETSLSRVQSKLATMSGTQQTGEQLYASARAEFEESQQLAEQRLPKMIDEKRKRLAALSREISRADVDTLIEQGRVLTEEIDSLSKSVQPKGTDRASRMFQQQARILATKYTQVSERLSKLEDLDAQLQRELTEKTSKLGGQKLLTGDEYKKYVNMARQTSSQVKRMKAELQELRGELGVLTRTREILSQQWDACRVRLMELEDKMGVSGFHETQQRLEEVSMQKSTVDRTKGKTLEDLSRVVQSMNKAIKSRKESLSPQIKELTKKRTEFQELEQEYASKKAVFDNTLAGFESERVKVEAEVAELSEEVQTYESQYHYLYSIREQLGVKAERARDEDLYLSGQKKFVGANFPNYSQMFKACIQANDKNVKRLRERHKYLMQNKDTLSKQKILFNDLKQILDSKVEIYKQHLQHALGTNAL